jgi:hypothetical protein
MSRRSHAIHKKAQTVCYTCNQTDGHASFLHALLGQQGDDAAAATHASYAAVHACIATTLVTQFATPHRQGQPLVIIMI